MLLKRKVLAKETIQLLLHGHSVKGFEGVERNENTKVDVKVDVNKIQNAMWCQSEPAVFCAHLSQSCYAVKLLPRMGPFLQKMLNGSNTKNNCVV